LGFGNPKKILAHSPLNCFTNGGLEGNYSNLELSHVLSPVFDLRSVTVDPLFSFWILYQTEMNYDGALVQVITSRPYDTWRTIGTLDANWYNNGDVSALANAGFGGIGWSGTINTWVRKFTTLTSVSGSYMRLRVSFASDSSDERLGFAFDDVSIQFQTAPTVQPSTRTNSGTNIPTRSTSNIPTTETSNVISMATNTMVINWFVSCALIVLFFH